MNHADHVNLLRPAGIARGGRWADLGAGSGAFTLALRELLGVEAIIYAVDKDSTRLEDLESAHRRRFAGTATLHTMHADLATATGLPGDLDGVVMANSLHFFRDKEPVLRRVRNLLRPGGTLLIVEYNVDRGNPWVPFPISFETFKNLAGRAGFSEPRLLAKHPSSFLKEFYSAAAVAVQAPISSSPNSDARSSPRGLKPRGRARAPARRLM